MKNIVTGFVAHVDAGKTTLTEKEFLYHLEDATKGRYIV